MVYLINSPILTAYGEWCFEGPLTVERAKTFIADGFTSAIGHEASAAFLSQLLGIDVATNRIAIEMQPGDAALVSRIKTRLSEAKVITTDEMAEIPFELGWLKRTR